DRHRRAHRHSRLAMGDAADRVQAVPGLPFHARLARRGGGGPRGAHARAGRDQERRRDGAGRRRLARPRACRPEAAAAPRRRGQGRRRARARDARVRAAGRPRDGAGTAQGGEGAGRSMSVAELSAEQQEIVATVRDFVDRDVIPVASELDHRDEFPTALVETMKGLGLFGTTIPEEYGGLGLGLDTFALILIELSRGWATLPGIMNGSFIAAWMLRMHGTEEQRRTWLPKLASGEIRAAFSMTEPHA